MKYILILFLSSLSYLSFCQVQINEEADIARLMDIYVENSRSLETFSGWRIQLITTNDRRKMESVKSQFNNLYPEIPLSWKHISPYYQVHIGAYRNKLELQGFLLELKNDFPNSLPVMDKIKKTEILQ